MSLLGNYVQCFEYYIENYFEYYVEQYSDYYIEQCFEYYIVLVEQLKLLFHSSCSTPFSCLCMHTHCHYFRSHNCPVEQD